jgi:hypothetical protein
MMNLGLLINKSKMIFNNIMNLFKQKSMNKNNNSNNKIKLNKKIMILEISLNFKINKLIN